MAPDTYIAERELQVTDLLRGDPLGSICRGMIIWSRVAMPTIINGARQPLLGLIGDFVCLQADRYEIYPESLTREIGICPGGAQLVWARPH